MWEPLFAHAVEDVLGQPRHPGRFGSSEWSRKCRSSPSGHGFGRTMTFRTTRRLFDTLTSPRFEHFFELSQNTSMRWSFDPGILRNYPWFTIVCHTLFVWPKCSFWGCNRDSICDNALSVVLLNKPRQRGQPILHMKCLGEMKLSNNYNLIYSGLRVDCTDRKRWWIYEPPCKERMEVCAIYFETTVTWYTARHFHVQCN